jgi:phage recombination protein Bet
VTPSDSSLLRRTITAQLSDDEYALFLAACERSGLDPFARQIYAMRRGNRLVIEATIDGLRLSAERTGKYSGQLGPEWCGPDGVWRDIWTSEQFPTAARVGIKRSDFTEPLWGKALYSEYVQETEFWRDMPTLMVAKVAEALAFRKAFPQQFSGLYTPEETESRANANRNTIPFPLQTDAQGYQSADCRQNSNGATREESGDDEHSLIVSETISGSSASDPEETQRVQSISAGVGVDDDTPSVRMARAIIPGYGLPEQDARKSVLPRGAVGKRHASKVSGSSACDPSESKPRRVGTPGDDPGRGGSGLSPVPAPLQPFLIDGRVGNHRNVKAAFRFIQGELENALGVREGAETFRRIYMRLPRIFKTREECSRATLACWCELWAIVEGAGKKVAA